MRRSGVFVAILIGLFAIAPMAWAQDITPGSATFTSGTGGSTTIDARAFSAKPALTATCKAGCGTTTTLPFNGISFTDNNDFALGPNPPAHDETGRLTVSSAATPGVFTITIAAATANPPDETDSVDFVLTILAAPATPTPVPVTGSSCATLDANQQPRSRFLRNDRFFVTGFLPGSNGTVDILFNGTRNIGTGQQTESGRYLVAAQVPSDAGFGGNTVVAKKLTVAATCGINVVPLAGGGGASATARPGSTNAPTTLPRTGSPILPMGVAGLLFLGTGTGMLLYYRRQAFAILSAVWTEADVFFAREESPVKRLFTGLLRKIRR